MKKLIFALLLLVPCAAWGTDYTADSACQGAWLFTEGSGTTVADSSPNSNTGNFKGAEEPTWDGSDKPSVAAYSVSFDGTDDYINCGADASLYSSTFTMVAWVKTPGTTTEQVVCGKLESVYGDPVFRMEVGEWEANNRTVGLVYRNGATWSGASTSSEVPSNTWTHIAVTLSGAHVVTAYINGESVSIDQPAVDIPANDGGNFVLGYNLIDSNYPFSGRIAEVAFFNRVLSSVEINDIMDNGLRHEESGGSTPSYAYPQVIILE